MRRHHAARTLGGLLTLAAAWSVMAQPVTHTVVIAEMQFSPRSLSVRRGDTVVWINKDFFPHNVTAQQGGTFASPELAPNQSWKYVAVEAGSFIYVCTLHPTMKAMLQVK